MTTEEDLRARISLDAPASKRKPKKAPLAWVPPTPMDFAEGIVLAYDQTLGKTGVSVLRHDQGEFVIHHGKLIKSADPGDVKGTEETLTRVVDMHQRLGASIMTWESVVEAIVHERPIEFGHRIESSLLAAASVRINAGQHARSTPLYMYGQRAVSGAFLPMGQRNANQGNKAHMKAFVESLIPPQNRESADNWNQDVTDSVSLGLFYLYQKARGLV